MIFVSDVGFKGASQSLTGGQLYLYRFGAFPASMSEMFYS